MKKYFLASCTLLLSLWSGLALATSLNLYDQPAANAKVVGTINTQTGVIPIFTPEKSEWVKVADPKNGNVGWVKQADLKSATSVVIKQNIISSGEPVGATQIIQVGPNKKTPAEMQAMVRELEIKQQALQAEMQKLMKEMFGQTFPFVLPAEPVSKEPKKNMLGEPVPVKQSK